MSRKKRQAKQVRYMTADDVPAGYCKACAVTADRNAQKCLYGAVMRGHLPAVVIGVGAPGIRRGSLFVNQEQATAYLERFYSPLCERNEAMPVPATTPLAEPVAAGQAELVAVMRDLVPVAQKLVDAQGLVAQVIDGLSRVADVADKLVAAVKPVAAAPHIRPAVRTLFGEPADQA